MCLDENELFTRKKTYSAAAEEGEIHCFEEQTYRGGKMIIEVASKEL